MFKELIWQKGGEKIDGEPGLSRISLLLACVSLSHIPCSRSSGSEGRSYVAYSYDHHGMSWQELMLLQWMHT